MIHVDRPSRPARHCSRLLSPASSIALALCLVLSACSGGRPPLLSKVLDADRSGRSAPIVTASPKSAGRASEGTTPSTSATGGGIEMSEVGEIDNVIYFGPDRYEVDDAYLPLIQAHAERLLAEPSLQVRIDAFTDPVGPADYNRELARMRAVMVQRQLRAMGVPARQIQIVAHGPGKRAKAGTGAGSSGTRTQASLRRVELNYR